eukprot:COSAG06_NODE_432_length_15846_cov_18.957325_3_plen_38_part_00
MRKIKQRRVFGAELVFRIDCTVREACGLPRQARDKTC